MRKALLFLLLLGFASPSYASFAYKATVVHDHTQVPSTQTNFTALWCSTDASLKPVGSGGQMQNASAYDIGVSDDGGATYVIPFELDSYDSATPKLCVWLLRSSLSASVDGTFIVGFGDPSLNTNPSSTSAWASGIKAVYLFGDGTTLDLTDFKNGNGLTNHSATATTGQIGGAIQTNGSTGYAYNAANSDLDLIVANNRLRISIWVKNSDPSQSNQYILSYRENTWAILYGFVANTYELYAGSSPVVRHTIKSGVSDTNWHRIGIAFDGAANQLDLYYDDVNTYSASETGDLNWTGAPQGLQLSTVDFGANGFLAASLDALIIGDSIPTTDGFTAEYNNQSNPSAGGFYVSVTFSSNAGAASSPSTVTLTGAGH